MNDGELKPADLLPGLRKLAEWYAADHPWPRILIQYADDGELETVAEPTLTDISWTNRNRPYATICDSYIFANWDCENLVDWTAPDDSEDLLPLAETVLMNFEPQPDDPA